MQRVFGAVDRWFTSSAWERLGSADRLMASAFDRWSVGPRPHAALAVVAWSIISLASIAGVIFFAFVVYQVSIAGVTRP